MTISELVELLKQDMRREFSHWHFYMNAGMRVVSLHRAEFKEFFLEEAAGEMKHIQEFGDMIVGLGGAPATESVAFRSDFTCPLDLVKEAIRMESEVVSNFVERMDQCEVIEKNGGLDKVDARYVHLFLEDQMMDSRKTVDELTQMLATSLSQFK